jgi:hypothetical protein
MESALYKTDEGNFVRFEEVPAKNEAASLAAGRPIFDKVLMATVVVPGSRQEAVHEIERTFSDGSVRRKDAVAQRFSRQLEVYRSQNKSADMVGTPLAQWPGMDVRQIAELNALNIYTVEALAGVSDGSLDRLGHGGRGLRDRAKAYLESAKGSAHAEHLASELAKRDETISNLERQVKELAALLEDKTKPGKKAA